MDFNPGIHFLLDRSHFYFPILILFDGRYVAITKIPLNDYSKKYGISVFT
jgi:hypothetical protein